MLLGQELKEQCPLCSGRKPLIILEGMSRSLVKCSHCGVAYLCPQPPESERVDFFSEEYISTDEDVEVRFGTRPQKSLSKVARYIHKRKIHGRILDLGCAGGHFLDAFFHAPDWDKWGVDLSKFAAQTAMTKSIRMHTGDIHSASLPPFSFDVVTVLDTFYYFPQPRRELEAIRKILKPDGLLVLVLTSARSHIWRNTGWRTRVLGGSQGSLFESHHVFFYDPPAIRDTLSRSGFRIDSIHPLPAIDQGSFLRNGLAAGYFAMSVAGWCLSGARLMLGPRFFVAASP